MIADSVEWREGRLGHYDGSADGVQVQPRRCVHRHQSCINADEALLGSLVERILDLDHLGVAVSVELLLQPLPRRSGLVEVIAPVQPGKLGELTERHVGAVAVEVFQVFLG